MNSNKRFQRRKEDFICFNCKMSVKGNGYTNHCPSCLWSKHVDKNPGDRLSECGGEMSPTGLFQKNSEYFLVHKCLKCSLEKNNKVSVDDNFDRMLSIVSREKN